MKPLKLFKQQRRFDSTNRPTINDKVMFSPCKMSTAQQDQSITINKPMIRKYLKPNQICLVIKHWPYLIEVQFPNQEDTDLVSPEFLFKPELTKAGKTILGENWDKLFKSA